MIDIESALNEPPFNLSQPEGALVLDSLKDPRRDSLAFRTSMGDNCSEVGLKLPPCPIALELHSDYMNESLLAACGNRLSFGSEQGKHEERETSMRPSIFEAIVEDELPTWETSSPEFMSPAVDPAAYATQAVYPEDSSGCSDTPVEMPVRGLQKQSSVPVVSAVPSPDERRSYSTDRSEKEVTGGRGCNKPCCNCSKTRCLKLYCECFASGQFCQDCPCEDCRNQPHFEQERLAALEHIASRNPLGYLRRQNATQRHPDPALQSLQSLQSALLAGCNCSKSGCKKNYCACFKRGVKCGESCQCLNCRNTERDVPCRRRRKKGTGLAKQQELALQTILSPT